MPGAPLRAPSPTLLKGRCFLRGGRGGADAGEGKLGGGWEGGGPDARVHSGGKVSPAPPTPANPAFGAPSPPQGPPRDPPIDPARRGARGKRGGASRGREFAGSQSERSVHSHVLPIEKSRPEGSPLQPSPTISSSAKCGVPWPARPPPPPRPLGGSPPRPPSPGGSAAPPRQRSSSEATPGRPPEDGGGVPVSVPPRSRTQSHEDAAVGVGVGGSPTSPRFRDPLLLLGLPEGRGDPDFFPRPPWSPLLAHYDVQSILFDPNEPPPGPPSLISGASAAHLEPEETPGSPQNAPDPEALVLSCPRFCCETGGEQQEPGLGGPPRDPLPGPGQLPNAAVAVLEEPPAGARPPHPIEHSDEGAEYYRKYFYGKEHHNLLGEDPRLGPVAVSLRREEKEGARPQVLHRIIVRTCQLRTLRGSVLEEALPPGCRPPGARAVPPRKLLEVLLPGLAVGGLRLAPAPAVQETLLKLDEQGVSRQRKVGVLYCRAGQGSEEQMYNNEGAGPAFEHFLNLLGTRVRLRGFGGYRAQLDTRTDSTGTHSLYTTYHGYEVMFHVSTMLPFTPATPSRYRGLLRKRHIGNDIVTIVFQEPGALPFSPRALRSHFQHVFLVVRVHEPGTPRTAYSVAVVRPDDTPPFGPPLAEGQRFLGGSGLRPFLLAKAINGENAAARGGRLGAMAARTRRQYLQELLRAHPGGPALPATPRGLPTLGGLRRGGGSAAGNAELMVGGGVAGALVWGARVETGGGPELPCLLGVAAERIVVVAAPPARAVFSCACRDVLGWAFSDGRLEIFHGRGAWIGLRLPRGSAEHVVARLQAVTRGCEAQELSLPREAGGRRGFRVDPRGVVSAVTRFSFADVAGLRPGARLLRVGRRPLPTGDPRGCGSCSGTLGSADPAAPRPRRAAQEEFLRALRAVPGAGPGLGGGPRPWGPPWGHRGQRQRLGGGRTATGGAPGGLLLTLDEERTPFPPGPPSPKNTNGAAPSPSPTLADPTPDLLLPHHSPAPAGDTGPPPAPGAPVAPPGPSLRQSLGRLLSGSGDPQDEEWDLIGAPGHGLQRGPGGHRPRGADRALWWEQRRRWLLSPSPTLDALGVGGGSRLRFAPRHRPLRLRLPHGGVLRARLDCAATPGRAVAALCGLLGLPHPEELSLLWPERVGEGRDPPPPPPDLDLTHLRPVVAPPPDTSGPSPEFAPPPHGSGHASKCGPSPLNAQALPPFICLSPFIRPSPSSSDPSPFICISPTPLWPLPSPSALLRPSPRVAPPPAQPRHWGEGPPRTPPEPPRDPPGATGAAARALVGRGAVAAGAGRGRGAGAGAALQIPVRPRGASARAALGAAAGAGAGIRPERGDGVQRGAGLRFAALQYLTEGPEWGEGRDPQDPPEPPPDLEAALEELELSLGGGATPGTPGLGEELGAPPELDEELEILRGSPWPFRGSRPARAALSGSSLSLWSPPSSGGPQQVLNLRGCEVTPQVDLGAQKFHIKLGVPPPGGGSETLLRCRDAPQFSRWLCSLQAASGWGSPSSGWGSPSLEEGSPSSEGGSPLLGEGSPSLGWGSPSPTALWAQIRGVLGVLGVQPDRGDPPGTPAQPPPDPRRLLPPRLQRRIKGKEFPQLLLRVLLREGPLSPPQARLRFLQAWRALPGFGLGVFIVRDWGALPGFALGGTGGN
ncbi:signal-induced proliferation-associated protein 1-like [Ammospiza caudacuta]|uniref:signal-induced proliferation-associated protein 1-like n=1 Tax=Ammospiza caudacuta TaxID=2857398 RepID=UPI0027387B9B|nr:signal-induced proliferation-associated protein 1-like [Ammospiza caudacuta]